MITIVSGLARCGSSMTMQMLHAGGMECCGFAPAFEDSRVNGLPNNGNWLDRCDGMAIKILDPLTFTPKTTLPVKTIWLDRNVKQQAKSWAKVLRDAGHDVKRAELPGYRKMLHGLRGDSIRLMIGNGPILIMRFEAILADPLMSAWQMREFIEQDMDVDAMAAVVVDRKPECLSYLLEKQQIGERNGS